MLRLVEEAADIGTHWYQRKYWQTRAFVQLEMNLNFHNSSVALQLSSSQKEKREGRQTATNCRTDLSLDEQVLRNQKHTCTSH